MEKRWVAESDERDCEICDGNAAEDWIPAEDAFSSGDDYPLAHPACRCDAQWRRAEDSKPDFIRVPEFSSVGDAEDWASEKLGIDANFGGDALIADIVTKALARVSEKGFEIPGIEVDEKIFIKNGEEDALGMYWEGTIYINPKDNFWNNPEEMTKEFYKMEIWSSQKKYHIIWHEIGHYLHRKQLSRDIYNNLLYFRIAEHKDIAMKVSRYASEGPREFVAELFSGLMAGKKYSKDIMNLYKQYGGVLIK